MFSYIPTNFVLSIIFIFTILEKIYKSNGFTTPSNHYKMLELALVVLEIHPSWEELICLLARTWHCAESLRIPSNILTQHTLVAID